ncbi:MAG: ThuA domain-containing protein [Pseudomonadota bacterium]
MSNETTKVYLVAAGDFHDIDFARLELLKLLAEDEKIRVEVGSSYDDIDAICSADFLLTYTCNVLPPDEIQAKLRDYVQNGGVWFALHGTNSILRFLDNGQVDSPEIAPVMMETLGTQFIAHPPIQPFTVNISDPDHELVKGIEPFQADDELYLCRIHGDLHFLLETRFQGDATGFVEDKWPDDIAHPVYYINAVGQGKVLYLNLGHCRGHYDMQPMVDYYPNVEKGAWAVPEYYELLRRGIQWCKAA